MYLVYSYLCRAFHSHHFIPASQQLCREGICMVSKFQEKKKLRPRDTKRLVPITEMANSQVNPKAHTHPCLVGDKQNPSGLGTSPPSWNNECAPPPNTSTACRSNTDFENKSIQQNVGGMSTYCNIHLPKDTPNSKSPSW